MERLEAVATFGAIVCKNNKFQLETVKRFGNALRFCPKSLIISQNVGGRQSLFLAHRLSLRWAKTNEVGYINIIKIKCLNICV